MSSIIDLQQRALEVAERYRTVGAKNGHLPWTGREYAMGFVGDVGDLLKLVMAKENLRDSKGIDIDAKLAHELSDCLWSVLILADKYGIDIEAAFNTTMQELDTRLDGAQS